MKNLVGRPLLKPMNTQKPEDEDIVKLPVSVGDSLMFSDIDLSARLADTEDHFTERKSKSDKGGWLRTTVAFANSTPIGYPAVLFIGVTDDGTITDNGSIEDLMKSFSSYVAEHCWPPIYTMPRVFTRSGKSCIAVIIPGSEARPHFAGNAYVRSGTQSLKASEEQYNLLIAGRNSKTRLLLDSKGKRVTFETIKNRFTPAPNSFRMDARVADCNQFYATLGIGDPESSLRSIPLAWIEISYDHENGRLKIVTE